MAVFAAEPGAPNSKKSKAEPATLAPKTGVKTPGIQIPFASLKAENELALAPTWLLASDSLLAPNPAKDALERIDNKTYKLGEPITGIAKPCGGAVSAFNSLWVASCGANGLLRIDPKTAKVTQTIGTGVGTAPMVLAASADSIWMFTDARTTLSRIDPIENKIVAETRLPAGCSSLAFGEGALWVACPGEDRLLRIDPLTNLIDKRIEVSAQPTAVAIGEGSIWVLGKKDGKLDRVDPKTFKVTKTIELSVPDAGGSLAIGQGFVWLTMPGFPLTRIDPQSDKVAQQFFGKGGGAVQFIAGSLWLTNTAEGTLWRIDPKRVLATLAE